ncbi:MAG: hypothetical protein HFI32_02345 [Lachnospiraceae bacterium]|nr:hypothetical protein [Lachnospiraceae bacterium]
MDIKKRIKNNRILVMADRWRKRNFQRNRIMQDHRKGTLHENKKIVMIHWDNPGAGLFAYYTQMLGLLAYVGSKGYVPVVDMENYPNPYLLKDEVGKVNAWEFFWEQPGGIRLEEACHAARLFTNNGRGATYFPSLNIHALESRKETAYWRRAAKQYIRLKKDVWEACEERYRELIAAEDKVLGVLCRGTDYIYQKPSGHPVQPEIERVLEKTEKVHKEFGCTKIFLATEDPEFAERFRETFGEMVVMNQRNFVNYDPQKIKWINDYVEDTGDGQREKGLDYLKTIYILSKCDCLVAGRTSGSLGAYMMSEGYEYAYFWDLGEY